MWPDTFIDRKEDCTRYKAVELALKLRAMYLQKDAETFTFDELIGLAKEVRAKVVEVKNLRIYKKRVCGYCVGVSNPEFSFSIKLAENKPLTIKKFTLAHEFGHTFFYDRTQNPPRSCNVHVLQAPLMILEDYFCEVFATVLLYPLEEAEKCRRWKWSDPELLLQSAEEYEVPSFVPLWVQLKFDPDFFTGQGCLK